MASKTLTVFKSDNCGGCIATMPFIRKYAERNGYKLKLIDVESDCGTPNNPAKVCENVKFTPTIRLGNHEVDVREIIKEVVEAKRTT